MSLRSEQLTTKYTLCSVLFFYPIPMFSLDQNTLQYINLSSGGREMPKTTTTTTTTTPPTIKPENYAHSPVHYAVVLADHTTLSTIISTLPSPPDPSQIRTDSDSLTQERIADYISTVLDRRDVPFRETPLHLAVRLNDIFAVRALATAGADASLQNSAGWNAIQEALCRRTSDFALVLLNLHHRNAWSKWRRCLPRVLAALHRMRDFYMEMSFHFESSVIPFVGKIAPSDTYKIWKRDGNLRADTSLAGFDGLKIQRADQSFLFLGDGDQARDIPSGSLLVLNRDDRSVFDPFENAGGPMSEADVAAFCSQTSVYRPGMDVTKAELVGRTNWRKQEKTESVGEWKAKVYDVQNVVFSFRSRKIAGAAGSEQVLDEDDEGFLAAEKKKEWVPQPRTKEKEYVKSLRPSIWLTEQFPLKTEELLPLLDILANKVKAVRRLRELLTTKLPPGTFPVKVAIPVVPTVRVVITFTKFVELQPVEQFYTPFSSPRHLSSETGRVDEEHKPERHRSSSSSSSVAYKWLRRNNSMSRAGNKQQQPQCSSMTLDCDTFAIPAGYTWTSVDSKSSKMKKSKSVRKSK